MSRILFIASAAAGFFAIAAAVPRLNSASKIGCNVLNVASTITAIEIVTNSSGGHALFPWRRRNTAAG